MNIIGKLLKELSNDINIFEIEPKIKPGGPLFLIRGVQAAILCLIFNLYISKTI